MTWSRTPQCSSKSSEMTRAPGRFAMITPPTPSSVACLAVGNSRSELAGDRCAFLVPMVVDDRQFEVWVRDQMTPHRTPSRQRLQR